MKRTRHPLMMASLLLALGSSSAQAASCAAMNALMAKYTKSSDAMDRETARNKSMSNPPRYDTRVCKAARNTAKAIKKLMPSIAPGCFSSQAAHSKAIDSLGSMWVHVAAVEGLSCAPGTRLY